MGTTDTVGQRIKRARLAKNEMTQKILGEELGGVDQTTVSMWEHGKTEPSFTMLGKIAAVLGVTPADLLNPDPAMPAFGAASVPVVFVPVVRALAPHVQGSLLYPGNVSDYAPFPSTKGNNVIGFVLEMALGGYEPGTTIFIHPQAVYGPHEKVVYLQSKQQSEAVMCCTYAEVPAGLKSAIVGAVVGHFRPVE